MTGGKLAEEMASGCPGMYFGEEGLCPNEGGTLDMGCQQTEPGRES